jgi:hypothetical protein
MGYLPVFKGLLLSNLIFTVAFASYIIPSIDCGSFENLHQNLHHKGMKKRKNNVKNNEKYFSKHILLY